MGKRLARVPFERGGPEKGYILLAGRTDALPKSFVRRRPRNRPSIPPAKYTLVRCLTRPRLMGVARLGRDLCLWPGPIPSVAECRAKPESVYQPRDRLLGPTRAPRSSEES